MLDTESFALHDQCERLRTWSSEYMLPRIPLAQAMHDALRVGLLEGDPEKTKQTFVSTAAMPGLEITAYNVYEIAMHHAAMLEVICTYLLGKDGAWIPAESSEITFKPNSYLLPDGRLRRVVLCSSWDQVRQQEEINSWRTAADVSMTNRPMLINAVVIGQSRKGFRPSPWTQAFIHPTTRQMRIQKRDGKFTDNWTRIYRESTDKKPDEWLKMMQEDGAFDGLVNSRVIDVSPRRDEILTEMAKLSKEIETNGTHMRRSACFKFSPCAFSKICHYSESITPAQAGWEKRT